MLVWRLQLLLGYVHVHDVAVQKIHTRCIRIEVGVVKITAYSLVHAR